MARISLALRGTGKGAKAPANLGKDHLAGASGGGEKSFAVHIDIPSIRVIISTRLTGGRDCPRFDLLRNDPAKVCSDIAGGLFGLDIDEFKDH